VPPPNTDDSLALVYDMPEIVHPDPQMIVDHHRSRETKNACHMLPNSFVLRLHLVSFFLYPMNLVSAHQLAARYWLT